ncbi:MAG: hypothetical protein F6K24_37480 [Okeania sp. SIO2D1]|uniref:hypothetical protein n=1 Tax=Okeania sp. SIO2C9 TaxID=2607791 RepID=UPI0013B8E0BC|nr:hypothetical protein [Okeania sp. SIO2C9]NEQ75290.1 hypothetical protein [Okeania sp. SIO2C9]NES70504.1 hypothetical protein [Okeania sp. SIO2D1]
MHTCPCCSTTLLRHARHNSIYWYCPRCREEMPDLELMLLTRSQVFQPRGDWLSTRKQNSRVLINVPA